MSSTLCNTLNLEDCSFFLRNFLRSYFTKIITSNALQSNSIALLVDIDQIIPLLLAKLSDPAFLQSIIEQFKHSSTPILDDFFLEELITDQNISEYITVAISEADKRGSYHAK